MRTGAGLCRVLATDPSALSLTYAWACIGAPDRVQIERRPTQGAEFRFACGAQEGGPGEENLVDFSEIVPIDRSRRALFGGVPPSFFSHGKHF